MRSFLPHWVIRWFARRYSSSAGDASPRAMAQTPMLDCEAVMRQLWDYLDGELTPARMAEIRAHVEMCQRCLPQYEFERSFLEALATRRPAHSDLERLRTTLVTALQARGLSEV